jgi:rSAM/selenodomain-associated transferase 2
LEQTRLAIVVPALNEEEALRRHLPAALAVADEVVVSDGGSTDRTPQVARELGARVVTGPPGRGGQLNRGAAAATADVLLFLHADTTLPPGGAQAVREAVAKGAAGGAFLVRFDSGGLMRLGSRLVNLRTRLTRLPLGDQGQFATRETFDRLGGFMDWPILEDLDFAKRLRRTGRFVLIEDAVTTGARRYLRQGVLRTVATNWLIWFLFFLGVSPHRLARLYGHIR